MKVLGFDRLHDDGYSDDVSNNFDRFPLPYVGSIHLDPKKLRDRKKRYEKSNININKM